MKERVKSIARTALSWIRRGFAFSETYAELWIAALWFAATLSVTLWVWKLEPVVFPATDEAVNRQAALLLRLTGKPYQALPFPDPEDLAHMRNWLTVGDRALPLYPPLTFYLYGGLSYLGKFGFLLIHVFPASAAAAFAAGVARLLPKGRRWLALLAPTLGFPGIYWLVRPWMNISLMTSYLCWALFFWAHWRSRGTTRWLVAALLSVGAASAVRPDYAAHLMSAALLFSLAAAPEQWKRTVAYSVAAGACAIAVNLVLNKVVTGNPLRPVYQLVIEEIDGESRKGPLGVLTTLITPMGVPSLDLLREFLRRYVLELGPLKLLVFGQLALIPLLWREKWLGRLLYLLALVPIFVAMATHVGLDLFGAEERVGWVSHSIPRYWAPVYLFAALPPLLFLGRTRFRLMCAVGAALAGTLGWLGMRENVVEQRTSWIYMERFIRTTTSWLDRVARSVPEGAIIYSVKDDRALWSRWNVGVIADPEPSARSIERAVKSGMQVFIHEPRRNSAMKRLRSLLDKKGLRVVVADRRQHILRVESRRRRR